MTVSIRTDEAVTIDLLRHAGIDETQVYEVTYHHRLGDVATLTVGVFLRDDKGQFFLVGEGDDQEVASETRHYEWRPVEFEPVLTSMDRRGASVDAP